MVTTPFYAQSSFWNTPIASGAGIDPNSGAVLQESVLPYTGRANFANGDDWGIGLAYASSSDKVYTIQNAIYYNSGPLSFRIPKGAQPSTGSDHHLVVIYGNQELDLWDASYNASTDTWSAGSRFIVDPNGWGANAAPGQFAGGAVAAGFSEMGGVVRPEEIAQGHIDHALSVMLPVIRSSYIASPATASVGTTTKPQAIPDGAHIQLDPSFNVAAQNWPTWEKVIAKALQTYGAYVSDTGGTVAFYGQTDANPSSVTWASVGVPSDPSLSNLPWSQMHVLTIPSASTGVSTTPAPTPPIVSTDTLILTLAEDQYAGNATFIAKVDGKVLNSATQVTALHSQAQSQKFTFAGMWGAGQHDIEIDFTNDQYSGPSQDRNLYIDQVSYNGVNYLTTAHELFNNGAFHVNVSS